MSRLLFTTLPSDDLGLLTRSLPIARELKLRGHEVAYCHPARCPQILITEGGFQNLLPDEPLYHMTSVTSLRGLLRLLARGRPLRTLKALKRTIRAFDQGSAAEIWNIDQFSATLDADTLRANVAAIAQLIQSFRADAVVDFWDLRACIAARILRKPLITVIQSQQHPESPGFIWWKAPPPDIPSAAPVINGVMREYGLPEIKTVGDLFIGDLTLVLGIPELDPLPQTARVTYLGPVLWQRPEAVVPRCITELTPDKPVVWVYTGTLRYAGRRPTGFDSEIVLKASIEALSAEDVQVVLTTGYHELPRSFLPLPENFRFEPFVPGLAMAKRSDIIIHHGGFGSCQTGVYVGTPAVIIPTFSERESNARRIVSQGAGELVLPTSDASGKNKKADPTDLAAKVRKVLSNPSYKENAARLRTRLCEYGGASEAARLIGERVRAEAQLGAAIGPLMKEADPYPQKSERCHEDR
jgi:UDP:flavonoid glycosyltransferase YjiC (YdhE family)